MTIVELSQHTIALDPPQRLLTLEVMTEENQLCLRIFPIDGVEVGDVRLVSKSSTLGSTAGERVEYDSMSLMRHLSEAFPQLAQIDIRNLPSEYRISFGAVPSPFHFEAGKRYRISGVGEDVWEAIAVAK